MNEAGWLTAKGPQPMLKVLQGRASDRKARLFAVACCRRLRAALTEEIAWEVVDAAERAADGEVLPRAQPGAPGAGAQGPRPARPPAGHEATWELIRATARTVTQAVTHARAWSAARDTAERVKIVAGAVAWYALEGQGITDTGLLNKAREATWVSER